MGKFYYKNLIHNLASSIIYITFVLNELVL